jgi:hypothetical protein
MGLIRNSTRRNSRFKTFSVPLCLRRSTYRVTSFRRDVSFLSVVLPSKREYRYGLLLYVAWSLKTGQYVRLTPKVARRTLQVASLENLRDNRLSAPVSRKPLDKGLRRRRARHPTSHNSFIDKDGGGEGKKAAMSHRHQQ